MLMTLEEGEAMAVGKLPAVPYDSEDNSWEDLMISDPICPFIIPVTIVGAQSA